ncbi:MAG: hypothetical protein HWD60_00485 [Defluviicoccus sp.]|nr:MAG: hypothetical protein HWD60_00485 [Defluviicoccus sp.]
MIATGSAHLFLPRGGEKPCVALGDALYRLVPGSPFAELAAWLPISLPEPDDDVLPVKGQVRWVDGHDGPQLVFESIDDQPFSIQMDEAALAGPHVRLCRGRARDGGWLRNIVVLEVENVVGLQLRCMLPQKVGLGPKTLRLLNPGTASNASSFRAEIRSRSLSV